MKKIVLLLIIVPLALSLAGQQVTLEECQQQARENYPNLKQSGLLGKISELNHENLRTNSLPVINLNGQATYQSDVTKVEIPIPNISMPVIPKDQYKFYIEARQSIWDGGITRMQDKLEETVLKTGLTQLETELYQLKEQVNDVFFTALLLQNQQKILAKQIETLNEKLLQVTSAVKNGVLDESNKWVIQAEVILAEQQKNKSEAGYNASKSILSLLTGKEISASRSLVYNQATLQEGKPLSRPELDLFSNRIDQLNAKSALADRLRYPKIFGFGQVGYGRPGLNMLNTKFDSFYLLGVGLSWNVWDFRKTQREKESITLQQNIISTQEETFRRNITILLTRVKSTIDEITSSLEKDRAIVELRKSVAEVSASKLKNGIMTPADYIRDLNAETVAMLTLEAHRIQLEEAKIKYNTILGN